MANRRAERKFAQLLDFYPELRTSPLPGDDQPIDYETFRLAFEDGGWRWWRSFRRELNEMRDNEEGPFAPPTEPEPVVVVQPEPGSEPVATDPEPTPTPAPEPEPVADDPDPALEPLTPEPEPEPEPEPDPSPAPAPAAPINQTGADGLFATYTSGLGDGGFTSDFNIDVVFAGFWTAELQAAVTKAAEYLSSVVTGDLADVNGVDDLSITVSLGVIDGAGGTLARANLNNIRSDGFLPYAARIEFDTRDALGLSEEMMLDLAVHEMMHGMGFGLLWTFMGLNEPQADGGVRFTGDAATAAFAAAYPALAAADPLAGVGPQVETDGGAGTAAIHWDDFLFQEELMTGFLNGSNTVSAMSVAALEDMGYATVWDAADPGALPPQPEDLLLA